MRKYDELMEQVKLTDEARARILEHIQTADASPAPAPRRLPWRKYLTAAACVGILILGAVTITPQKTAEPHVDQPQRPVLGGVQGTVPDTVEAASVQELSGLVGFPVEEPEGLPFEVVDRAYIARAETVAEIRYSGGEQAAVFRKSVGNGDNSGCEGPFVVEGPFESGTYTGTLKGNVEDEFTLAVWTDGEAAYSLRLTQGISKDRWMELVGG